MKKQEIAKRLYEIGNEIKGLEDEKEELRIRLAGRMEPDEVVSFLTPEGPYRAKLVECSEKVLRDNAEIHALVGDVAFIQAAKIGCGALEKVLKDEALFARCIKGVVKKNVLKVLKGVE